MVVNIVSTRSHIRLVRELNHGGTGYNRPSSLGITVGMTPAVLALAMVGYLALAGGARQEILGKGEEKSMNAASGITTIPSHQSVDGTVEKLEQILQAKGIKLFALIDHSGEAEKAGLHMRPTKLLIFGNPKAGTPLMIASPSIAIDLPMKILVAEDSQGRVWVSYNDPAYLQARHGLPADLVPNIAVVEALAAKGGE
jgi:uncharacterized protein (DUF302 family)